MCPTSPSRVQACTHSCGDAGLLSAAGGRSAWGVRLLRLSAALQALDRVSGIHWPAPSTCQRRLGRLTVVGWDLPTLPRVLFLHEVTSSESNIFKSCLHGFLQPVMIFSMWIFKLNFYSFRSYTYTEGTESNGCPRLVIKNMDLHLQFPTPQRWLTFTLLADGFHTSRVQTICLSD